MNQRKRAVMLLTSYIIALILIFVLVKEALYSNVQASSIILDNKNPKVVIIIADHIELQDFAENDYLSKFFNSSYSAMISGRQNGKPSAAKAKLTIGSSKRLNIDVNMKSAYNYIDQNPNVIYTDINKLRTKNFKVDYESYIGYLGDKLNQYDKTTCVIGNSDSEEIDRSAALIAMDGEGIIDGGDVENTIVSDYDFPGGIRTDYYRLSTLYDKYIESTDLLIIDTGDLARLEHYKSEISREIYETTRKETIINISNYLQHIISNSDPEIMFMLFSSYPSERNLKSGMKLTPIVVNTGEAAGFLYSQSTKRKGIITNLDLAEYILQKIGINKKSNITEIHELTPLRSMLSLVRRLLNISVMRLPVLTWYAMFEIICATAGLIYLLNLNNKNSNANMLFKILMLANIVAPAVLLYMAGLNINSSAVYFWIFILLSIIIAILFYRIIKGSTGQFLGASLFVNLSITIDLLRQSAFIKNSVLGYDPIIGARFYGIGNEFAGVFIGSGILLAGCTLQHFKQQANNKPKKTLFILMIYSFSQVIMIGMPFLGANFGATFAAVAGHSFFFCIAGGYKIRVKQLIIMAIVLVLALSGIIFLDLQNPSKSTHVGKFITDIKDNGIKVLFSTITRKAAMNIRLIKYTIWTKVLLCIILIISVMFFKPVRLLRSIFKKYEYFTAAWLGISAGSIVGLIVNDSGIVMAATAMIFTGYTILYICLEERATLK